MLGDIINATVLKVLDSRYVPQPKATGKTQVVPMNHGQFALIKDRYMVVVGKHT
jgi:hypothetical protein